MQDKDCGCPNSLWTFLLLSYTHPLGLPVNVLPVQDNKFLVKAVFRNNHNLTLAQMLKCDISRSHTGDM